MITRYKAVPVLALRPCQSECEKWKNIIVICTSASILLLSITLNIHFYYFDKSMTISYTANGSFENVDSYNRVLLLFRKFNLKYAQAWSCLN